MTRPSHRNRPVIMGYLTTECLNLIKQTNQQLCIHLRLRPCHTAFVHTVPLQCYTHWNTPSHLYTPHNSKHNSQDDNKHAEIASSFIVCKGTVVCMLLQQAWLFYSQSGVEAKRFADNQLSVQFILEDPWERGIPCIRLLFWFLESPNCVGLPKKALK